VPAHSSLTRSIRGCGAVDNMDIEHPTLNIEHASEEAVRRFLFILENDSHERSLFEAFEKRQMGKFINSFWIGRIESKSIEFTL
jgi:hypothetical protein